jgi:hypothetical protein
VRSKAILFAWLTLFVGTASAGSIRVNGLCEIGNCTTPDTLASNAAMTDPFNFVYTLPDTDQFRIQGELVASDTDGLAWSLIGSQFTATFLGNSSRTASGGDVLTVDFLQNFQNYSTVEDVSEVFYGGFGGPLALSGTSSTEQGFLGSTALPLNGPFSPPPYLFSHTLSSTLSVDGRFTASFGAGSDPGAFMILSTVPVSLPVTTPEPATSGLLLVGLACASIILQPNPRSRIG